MKLLARDSMSQLPARLTFGLGLGTSSRDLTGSVQVGFKYLSSIFTFDCTSNADITHRVDAANSAFQQIRQASIWSTRALTLSVNMQFFQFILMSVLLYSGKTWAVVKQHGSPLAVGPVGTISSVISAAGHSRFPDTVHQGRALQRVLIDHLSK